MVVRSAKEMRLKMYITSFFAVAHEADQVLPRQEGKEKRGEKVPEPCWSDMRFINYYIFIILYSLFFILYLKEKVDEDYA